MCQINELFGEYLKFKKTPCFSYNKNISAKCKGAHTIKNVTENLIYPENAIQFALFFHFKNKDRVVKNGNSFILVLLHC